MRPDQTVVLVSYHKNASILRESGSQTPAFDTQVRIRDQFSFATMVKKMERKPGIPTDGIRAFVLCGGHGTRLRPVLTDRPKTMALISGTPFLKLFLDRLRSQGIDDVIFGTGYMADKIEDYFGSGRN